MISSDTRIFLKYLLALLVGQIMLAAFASMFPNAYTNEAKIMSAEIASPSGAFLLTASLVSPAAESGILVFFIWAARAMKAKPWIVHIIVGAIFGLMHASFGVGKVLVTTYAGIIYSIFFHDAGSWFPAYLKLWALHAFNNVLVLAGVNLLANANF